MPTATAKSKYSNIISLSNLSDRLVLNNKKPHIILCKLCCRDKGSQIKIMFIIYHISCWGFISNTSDNSFYLEVICW